MPRTPGVVRGARRELMSANATHASSGTHRGNGGARLHFAPPHFPPHQQRRPVAFDTTQPTTATTGTMTPHAILPQLQPDEAARRPELGSEPKTNFPILHDVEPSEFWSRVTVIGPN